MAATTPASRNRPLPRLAGLGARIEQQFGFGAHHVRADLDLAVSRREHRPVWRTRSWDGGIVAVRVAEWAGQRRGAARLFQLFGRQERLFREQRSSSSS